MKASSPVRSSACPRRCRSRPRLQHRPAPGAARPLRLQPGRQQRLPARRRRHHGDYHEGFTIDVPALPLGIENLILKNRLVFNGRSGDGTFITTPSTCYDPEEPAHEHVYSTYLLASSIDEEAEARVRIPGRRRAGDRVAAAAGQKADRLRTHPLRPDDRARSGHRRRPTRPPARPPKSWSHTSSAAKNATARTPKKHRSRCRKGSASTPRRAPACSPAPTPSSARAPRPRSPARRRRRSASSKSKRRRCPAPTASSKATSSSAPSRAATRPRATSTGSSSTPSRRATASR